jgi:hypothetical protein
VEVTHLLYTHMKVCSKCKLPKKEFVSWRENYCVDCRREYDRQRYLKNPKYYKKKAANSLKRGKDEKQEKVVQYLLSHPCVDCGESDPIVLQFDHQRDKIEGICRMVYRNFSWKRIEEVIAKCEVRCANCHLKRTTRVGNHRRYKILERKRCGSI